MTVEVSTSQYEFAHGHRPRGVGRWVFLLAGCLWDPTRDSGQPLGHGPAQSYADAKRLAVAEARRRRVSRVEVAT